MKRQVDKNIMKNSMIVIGLLAVLVSVFGCAGNYGRLSYNRDVKAQFENYEILPDHRYYYSGPVARPRAVIGVQEAYTLQSDLWVPIDLTTQQLKGWVDYYGPAKIFGQENNGFDILAPDGKKIGVWYAIVNWKDYAVVKMIDEKVVNISAPIESNDNPRFFAIFPPEVGPGQAEFPED